MCFYQRQTDGIKSVAVLIEERRREAKRLERGMSEVQTKFPTGGQGPASRHWNGSLALTVSSMLSSSFVHS